MYSEFDLWDVVLIWASGEDVVCDGDTLSIVCEEPEDE